MHRAYDVLSHEDVAIKIIEVSSDLFAERVRRELRAARRVTHLNVVRLHDIVEDGTSLVLSMELVHGQSLEQWLSVHTDPEEATIMRMAREIAAGVAAAHDAGVIHRDLKPANVMVRSGSGACLVTDFGVARTSERRGSLDATREGDLVGTPLYMAPEQLAGSLDIGPAADVYSLGLVLYELATGTRPHRADSIVGLATARLQGELPDLTGVLPALRPALARCLAAVPSERYANAGELALALGNPKPSSSPRPARPVSRLRGRLTAAVAASLLVALFIGGGALALRDRTPVADASEPLRIYVRTIPPAPDDATWMNRAGTAQVLWHLGPESSRFRLVKATEPRDLVVAFEGRVVPTGVEIELLSGPSEEALTTVSRGEGPTLDNAIEAAVPALVERLTRGRRHREPTPQEAEEMRACSAPSLAAFVKYRLGIETNHRPTLESALKDAPDWAHLHAALMLDTRAYGGTPDPPAAVIDGARDPSGRALVDLLADSATVFDGALVGQRLASAQCAPADELCDMVRSRFSKAQTSAQQLETAQRVCGPTFRNRVGCIEVVTLLALTASNDTAQTFIAEWSRARPSETQAIVLLAEAAFRSGDLEAARAARGRLTLLGPDSLAAQGAISVALDDVSAAAANAAKMAAEEYSASFGSYHMAIVSIQQGAFGRAIALLQDLTTRDTGTICDLAFEALVDLHDGLGNRSEAVATLDRWLAASSPPPGLALYTRRLQRDLLAAPKTCPRIPDLVAAAAVKPSHRADLERGLRRVAAAYGCESCRTVLGESTPTSVHVDENVALARCALSEGLLELAESVFEREARIMLFELDPVRKAAPYSSMAARLYLAETYVRQGRTEDARAQLERFLAGWQNADRIPPALARARALRAGLDAKARP